jgi:hypothetical protein
MYGYGMFEHKLKFESAVKVIQFMLGSSIIIEIEIDIDRSQR